MSSHQEPEQEARYVGFWLRVLAAVVDTILLLAIILPLLLKLYGLAYFFDRETITGPWGELLTWVFPVIAILVFWFSKSATPGKMAIGAKIVDARTGAKPTTFQYLIRYLGYYVSTLPMGLGLIWVAFDKRKQGWHDKIARTVVIHTSTHEKNQPVEPTDNKETR
jgi:uncharacterized RDD family membrane protein YckC